MKKFGQILALIVLMISEALSQCGGGELYFRIKDLTQYINYHLDLTITTSNYAWAWNFSDGSPYPVQDYSYTNTNLNCYPFAAPTNSSTNLRIPWGLFSIQLVAKTGENTLNTRNFQLDMRDNRWSNTGGDYPGVDTYVEYDVPNNILRLLKNS